MPRRPEAEVLEREAKLRVHVELLRWSSRHVGESKLLRLGVGMDQIGHASDGICIRWDMHQMGNASDGICIRWDMNQMGYASDGICIRWEMHQMGYASDGI